MTTTTIRPQAIHAPHEVTDQAKVQVIAAAMRAHGWQGEPLLVVRCGDEYAGWTGTHRLAAARAAGIEADVYLWEITDEQRDALTASGWYDARYCHPRDQEAIYYEMQALDGMDAEALRIMRAEISKDA